MTPSALPIDSVAPFPLLSIVTFLPLVGVLLLAFVPREQKNTLRNLALGVSVLVALASFGVYTMFDENLAGLQLVEKVAWLDASVTYTVGVDGISLLLVMLTTLLSPLVILSTYTAVQDRVKEFMISLLALETGMLGALLAVDLFLFYVFWEFMLIPMYLLIGVWGGKRRIYAAVKFFIYTMLGSLLMLVAIIYLYLKAGSAAFVDILALELSATEQLWLFLAFALAFAVKVPLFPFHTWLPDAHVEAPTAGSVILAGVLLKLGTYGLMRFAIPLFPEATGTFSMPIALLAVIGIIYGALVAYAQTDIKKLVAYSSVSHLGFVVLGLIAMTPQGLQGGLIQMVNHGVSTGALFLLVGVIYERRHTRDMDAFGGLARVMPLFATVFMIITLSSIGLPGTNGFVGEFLILTGSFNDGLYHLLAPPVPRSGWHWVAVAALALVALGAVAAAVWRVGPGRGYPKGKLGARDWLAVSGRLALAAAAGAGAFVVLGVPLPLFAQWRVFMVLMAGVATTGVVLGAVYMLTMYRKVMFGPVTRPENEKLRDLSLRESFVLLPLVAFVFLIGLAPGLFLDKTKASIDAYVAHYRPRVMAQRAPLTFDKKGERLIEQLRAITEAREARRK